MSPAGRGVIVPIVAGFQRDRDEALLTAVVQVAFEPPSRLVRRGDDTGPDAMSSVRVSAFEIAVVIRSAKLAMRPSAAAGRAPPDAKLSASAAPHSRSSMMIGALTRDPADPASHRGELSGSPAVAVHAGRATGTVHPRDDALESPVRTDRPETGIAPRGQDRPGRVGFEADDARYLGARTRPISSATAAKTSSGGVPRATSMATRRSAACSSASCSISVRASVFAIAVAIRSVKAARRSRVSAGNGG